jgi:hypothetical protein
MRAKFRRLPLRLASGSFILNAGMGKWDADEETAARLHSMASGTYPLLDRMDPRTFTKALALSEIALGTMMLLPVVPSQLAGLGLSAFASGLLGIYMKTPGLRHEGSIRPTQQGVPIAKDVWLLGTGLSLLFDWGERSRARD